MTSKTVIKSILSMFGLILAFNFSVFAQKADSSKINDTNIVVAIYETIKVKYNSQIEHINVSVDNGIVTIEGWATTKKIKNEIGKYAKKANGVEKVLNKLTVGVSTGCAPGMKECGGACISEKSACNVCLADPLLPGCLTKN